MKKLLAILLAVMMFASMATIASAASTTTLTTTVPAATYTLNIPANQEIAFGATQTNLGNITVSDATGFALGKNLNITLIYDNFTCINTNTTIPMNIVAYYHSPSAINDATEMVDISSGDALIFKGTSSGSVSTPVFSYQNRLPLDSLLLEIKSEDWGMALAGEYTATITFTAEVVVE